jgi:hypothetical protein
MSIYDPAYAGKPWQIDTSRLALDFADELDALLDEAHAQYADLAGLVVGTYPNMKRHFREQWRTSNALMQCVSPRDPRQRAWCLAYHRDALTSRAALRDWQTRSVNASWSYHVNFADLAWHEIGHAVRRNNPAGHASMNEIIRIHNRRNRADAIYARTVENCLGRYHYKNGEEFFAEIFRHYAGQTLPRLLEDAFGVPLRQLEVARERELTGVAIAAERVSCRSDSRA